jgi:hypothetical protein
MLASCCSRDPQASRGASRCNTLRRQGKARPAASGSAQAPSADADRADDFHGAGTAGYAHHHPDADNAGGTNDADYSTHTHHSNRTRDTHHSDHAGDTHHADDTHYDAPARRGPCCHLGVRRWLYWWRGCACCACAPVVDVRRE